MVAAQAEAAKIIQPKTSESGIAAANYDHLTAAAQQQANNPSELGSGQQSLLISTDEIINQLDPNLL